MKNKTLAVALCVLPLSMATAQVALDNASGYPGGSWTAGSNGGFGFTPWTFGNTQGTGAAGVFIGDPSAAGVTGMSPQSFGFYANPLGSGANAEVSRGLLSPLTPGQTFSFQWGLNWDSDSATSNRGFNLRHGVTELLNINMGNSATITINSQPMFTQFGTQAFTLNFEQLTPTSVRVYGTGRNGVETYDSTFSGLLGPIDGFSFYFNATSTPDAPNQAARQMYVNNLEVVPEPNSLSLLALSALGLMLYRYKARRRNNR